jgi:hypothetical protein
MAKKTKYTRPKPRKRWEKRGWSALKLNGDPQITDLPGTRSAYAWAKKNGFRVQIKKLGDGYCVWRIE